MPDKKAVIVGFVSAAVLFLTLFFSGVSLLDDILFRETLSFYWTAERIASIYPLPFSQGTALKAAENEVFHQLDPFSFRMKKSDYDNMCEESSGQYGGIGISVIPRDSFLIVMSVREGGPADKGGMKSGDHIIKVNGGPVPPDDPQSITDSIRGPSGTSVALTVYRPRIDDTLSLIVERKAIHLEHIPYAGVTADSIVYIRLIDFEAGAADDLRRVIKKYEPRNPVGYILDLKENPGGYLQEAIEAADIFMKDGQLVVGTDSRSRWEKREFRSHSDPITERPMVILTDKGTASAAEILTGALRGVDRAITVGDTTFGKGLVQSVYSLFNGDAVKLTTSRYYFADGRYLNPPDSQLAFSGLAPDIMFTGDVELSFQRLLLSGFLPYDFIDAHWDYLSTLPDNFAYPDTVVTMFGDFMKRQNIDYSSKLTRAISMIIKFQSMELASDTVVTQLNKALSLSENIDSNAYKRYGDYVRYQIRKLVVERKSGQKASYQYVIVPGRADIKLASDILLNKEKYEKLLSSGKQVASQ